MFFLIDFEEIFTYLEADIATEFSATHFLKANAFFEFILELLNIYHLMWFLEREQCLHPLTDIQKHLIAFNTNFYCEGILKWNFFFIS